MLIAQEFVPFRYLIIILDNTESLGIGIFEDHFSFILPKASKLP